MAGALSTGTFQLRIVGADVLTEGKSSASGKRAENNLQQGLLLPEKSVVRLELSVKDRESENENAERGLYRAENNPLNIAAIGSLLGHYSVANALSDGRGIHASIIGYGYDRDIYLQNCLILMYGNCGRIEDARAAFEKISNPNSYSWNILINAYAQNGSLGYAQFIFDKMPERDVVSWNTIISACTHTGHDVEALSFFHQMQIEGIKPNKSTFMCALDACSTLEDLAEGRKVHAVIRENKYEQDLIVGTALVSMYGKCGSPHNARKVFCRIEGRSVVSWSAMIQAYVQNELPDEALHLLQKMQLEAMKPNKVTFISALDACAMMAALEEGWTIHAALVDIGSEQEIKASTALINMYGKCSRVHEAMSVFARSCRHDVTSWSALIGVCAQNAHTTEALNLFSQMQYEGFEPNKVTFVCILYACTSLATQGAMKSIHSSIVSSGCEADVLVGTALVTMYGRCGSLGDAGRVFGKIRQPCVISWNALITASNQNGCGKEVLKLFSLMCHEGVKPNKITFVCVLDACSSMAALEVGQEIHASIIEAGHDMDPIVGSALINLYGKCGSLDKAVTIFRNLTQQSAVSWSAVIAACSQNGYDNEALDLFSQMQLEGVKPNKITYICALTACSHAGRVDDAWHYFISMKRDYGITHDFKHYVCMIDLLGRAGQLEEAEDLINNTPSKKVVLAWLSLLSACRIHRDVERGKRAASHCLKLGIESDAPYVLLSNVYAAAGRWDSVEKVEDVKENCWEKLAGQQLTDVNEMFSQFDTRCLSRFHGEEVQTELQMLSKQELFETMNG